MADFVAVIRRAVDGLSNNTPEMRAKVYEKARGAVLRQLENMSPRPPEDMIRRQMDKLTAAISEVEAEHAVALPEVEEPVAYEPEPERYEPEPVAVAPEPEPAAPEPEPEPVTAAYDYGRREPAPDDYSAPVENLPSSDVDAPQAYADQNYSAPVDRPSPAFATADDWMSEPYGVRKDEPAPVIPVAAERVEQPLAAAPAPVPDFGYQTSYPADDLVEAPEQQKPPVEPVYIEPAPVPSFAATSPVAPLFPEELPAVETKEPTRTETDVAYDAWASFPASGTPAQGSHDLGTEIDWPTDSPARAPAPQAASIESDFDAFLNSVKSMDSPKAPPAPAMPAAGIDLLDWHDELASLPPLSATGPAAAAQPASKPAVKQAPAPIVVPKNESFDDLLDNSLSSPTSAVAGPGAGASVDATDIDDFLASAPQTAYRKETKPRRNFVPLILGLAVVILIGGGGYAVWANRSEINAFFAGLTSSTSDTAPTENAAQTPETTPAASETTPPAAETASAPVTGAPEEGVASVQKFTQRLKPDGTEVDEGAAGANGASGEGRSVAQQTVAPTGEAGATPSASAATPPAATNTTTPPAVANTPLTVGSQERAFLYEERLGQVSPTAIVGGIEWTAMRDSGPDGRPDPAIQGKLSIPERGLNALITFRRNNDSSLPASHLVEIVFSMPSDFEGGAIDAVQRVSLKRTEQDRGDPLVGVAAKVTDDTFLIALNDFQDVVARNMDLISNRSWIDIPITYRNGRRALLTLDKGSNGTALFQQVVREWAALAPAAPAN